MYVLLIISVTSFESTENFKYPSLIYFLKLSPKPMSLDEMTLAEMA